MRVLGAWQQQPGRKETCKLVVAALLLCRWVANRVCYNKELRRTEERTPAWCAACKRMSGVSPALGSRVSRSGRGAVALYDVPKLKFIHVFDCCLLQASFVGAIAITDLVKSTLGPKGMVGAADCTNTPRSTARQQQHARVQQSRFKAAQGSSSVCVAVCALPHTIWRAQPLCHRVAANSCRGHCQPQTSSCQQ